jgi:hypothetical protein
MRMSTTFWVGAMVIAAALSFAEPVSAHHGGDVEWADDTVGPITGTATKFAFQFPHVFFEMNVGEPTAATTWMITTRWTPTILRQHGWSRDSIKPGDTVTITYVPHIDKAQVGQMITIEVNGTALPLSF